MTAILVTASASLTLLISVLVGFAMSQARAKMKHAEQMKALEMGRELSEESSRSLGKKAAGRDADSTVAEESTPDSPNAFAGECFGAAFWIGFWGFAFATQAGAVFNNGGSQAVSIAIAAATGASVMTALICGTVLACQPVRQTPIRVEKPDYAHEEV